MSVSAVSLRFYYQEIKSFSEKHFCGWEGPQKFSLKLFNIRHCQIRLKIKLPKLTLEKGVLVAGFKKLADH